MKLFITGVVLMLIALWGGSYVVFSLPDNHWAEFPSLLTSLLLFMSGGSTAIFNIPDIFD